METIVAAVIGAFAVIAAALLPLYLKKRSEAHLQGKITTISILRVYAISTTNIVSAFEQNYQVKVDSCVVLIRLLDPAHPLIAGKQKEYQEEIKARIGRWKAMVEEGRIKHLTIIGCPNIPDICYLIADQQSAHIYINKIDFNDPCNQSVDKKPFHNLSAKDPDEAQKIALLTAQFDSYVAYYKEHGIKLVYP